MKQVEVVIQGLAPYSQSAMHETPKLNKETHEDFDARTWREKCTVDADGTVCIPAMAFKQALDKAAKVLGEQIPGKGKNTYTKHFKAGVLCETDVSLGIQKDEIGSVTLWVNSDGVRGSGKRVKRTFPVVPTWKGTARFLILDDTVAASLRSAPQLISTPGNASPCNSSNIPQGRSGQACVIIPISTRDPASGTPPGAACSPRAR